MSRIVPISGQTSLFENMQSYTHPTVPQLEHMHHALVDGLRTFFTEQGFHKAVVGLSGGVDSALTLKIAVDALGSENVTALMMPEIGLTQSRNIEHAKGLCAFFGVKNYYVPINGLLQDFNTAPWKPNKIGQMNVKARVRSVLLYSYANTENALVLGTSNKSETLLGYGTKFGDLAADIEVIGELLKTEVIALADHVGLPPEIVNKKPSAELAPGQNDEEDMGALYVDMDKVLVHVHEGEEKCIELGFPSSLVHLVCKRYRSGAHKRIMPPSIKIR